MALAQHPLDPASLAAAYAACERLAREHYENFPVASRLLPPRMRPHVAAVYGFARIADDFADEDERPAAERQQLLDEWLGRLRASVHVDTSSSPVAARSRDDLLFLALGNTIRECHLPLTLFEDLLSAFRQDTEKRRYEDFDEVLDYCRRSANPVGRLVLRIAGHEDGRIDGASDCVCTALQLANFWQDLERDWDRGRLYVPLAELRAAGASERDLDTKRLTAPWRAALSSLVGRTKDLFIRGRGIADLVGGRLGFELRLTWLGGWRILERIEAQGYDVFGRRPALGRADLAPLLWRAIAWHRQPASSRRSITSAAGPSAS